MPQNEHHKLLVQRYSNGSANADEVQLFFHLLRQGMLDEYLTEDMNLLAGITAQDEQDANIISIQPAPVRKIYNWKRWVAAASVLLVIGLGSYLLFFNKNNKQLEIVQSQDQRFKNDVNPGGYKARLTLADGTVVVLDSVVNGELAKQGGTVVLNKDGQLVYDSKNKTTEVLYNTLSTARGETYATVLTDGSKVWLNSASSIKYPVAFNGNERRVEITGEAYFEVAKDATKKFLVIGNGVTTEVLGTHFNVNTYTDEKSINVTLLEGSVKTSMVNGESAILKPGQQAQVAAGIKVVNNVNLEEVMAWKNGYFSFENADVQSIMRAIARWYDLEIVYSSNAINGKIHLEANRSMSLKNVLRIVELTGGVRFVIEDKKVTVIN